MAHWKAGRSTDCLLRGLMGPPRVFPGPKPPDDVALARHGTAVPGLSSTSRTVRASCSGRNGLVRSVIPGPSTPCQRSASAVYPDRYSTFRPGQTPLIESASWGPLMLGITTSVTRRLTGRPLVGPPDDCEREAAVTARRDDQPAARVGRIGLRMAWWTERHQ